MRCGLNVFEWLIERRDNCLRIAEEKPADERLGWVEDAAYFQAAIQLIQGIEPREAIRGPIHADLDECPFCHRAIAFTAYDYHVKNCSGRPS